mgnify:FL=1
MPLHLDYFYGRVAEQYSFYRVPKVLFTDSHYKTISVEAKVLYGLLLAYGIPNPGYPTPFGQSPSIRSCLCYLNAPQKTVFTSVL